MTVLQKRCKSTTYYREKQGKKEIFRLKYTGWKMKEKRKHLVTSENINFKKGKWKNVPISTAGKICKIFWSDKDINASRCDLTERSHKTYFLDSVGIMVGLFNHGGLFQPKWFCDSRLNKNNNNNKKTNQQLKTPYAHTNTLDISSHKWSFVNARDSLCYVSLLSGTLVVIYHECS